MSEDVKIATEKTGNETMNKASVRETLVNIKNPEAYIHFPVKLIEDSSYQTISLGSRVIYALLFDRMIKNYKEENWIDENGDIYVIYPRAEIAKILKCSEKKITRHFEDLKNQNFIREKRMGLGQFNKIYLYSID